MWGRVPAKGQRTEEGKGVPKPKSFWDSIPKQARGMGTGTLPLQNESIPG